MKPRQLWLAALIGGLACSASAHGTENHAPKAPAPLPKAVDALPWNIGGPFTLTDQSGQLRTESDPDGHLQLVFFGYANCPGICSAALPLMADVADLLGERGIPARPVLITIDPVLDTVETMGPALAEVSNEFIGLTGDRAALNVAYAAFQIEFEKIMDDPEHGPIYAHGSHIYLLDAAGTVLTLVPPVMSAQHMADIVARYAPR